MQDFRHKLLEWTDSAAEIYTLLTRLTLSEDAAAQLLLQLLAELRRSPRFAQAASARVFAHRAAIVLAFDWRRARRHQPIRLDDGAQRPGVDDSATADHVPQEELEDVLNAIGLLRKRPREVIVMRYIEQRSYDDIARRLGITSSHVSTVCHRARQRLQTLINRDAAPGCACNERKLLRRLQALSQIEPTLKKTEDAVRNLRSAAEQIGDAQPPRAFLTPRRLAVASAVVLCILTIIAAALLWNPTPAPTDKTADITPTPAAPSPSDSTPKTAKPAAPVTSSKPTKTTTPEIKEELRQIVALADSGDVDGLLKTLDRASFAGKLAAAAYLADIGDERAITPLLDIGLTWYGTDSDNPFAAAAARIQDRLARDNAPVDQSAADAETDKTSPASAFKELVHVHCVQETEFAGGIVLKTETWIKLPDCIRCDDDETGRTVIDNGTQRLTLNTREQQARLSESQKQSQPPRDHPLIRQIEIWRGRTQHPDVTLTKIDAECTEQTLVYSLEQGGEDPSQGKLWLDLAGMLPTRLELRPAGGPNPAYWRAKRMTFDYQPIADTVFALRIPEGYTDLAKQKRAFQGHVIDAEGRPIPNAAVGVKSFAQELVGRTNEDGFFTIDIPAGKPALLSPVAIWATLPDTPDFIGWTLLQSDTDKNRYALGLNGEIPGDPGTVAVASDQTGWCSGASNVVIVMEPAGRITGTVSDTTGDPLAGAAVEVRFEPAGRRFPNYPYECVWATRAVTNEQGVYQVGYLPPLWKGCCWHVSAAAEGFVGQADVIVSDGPLDTMTVNLQLQPAVVTIRGVLKNDLGVPLPDRPVCALVGGLRYAACAARTDAAGRFELKNCPDALGLGVLALLEIDSRTADRTSPFRSYPDQAADVPYEPGRTDYYVEIIVPSQ
ncbi:MAG: sigma-70 family RNA polymerase sigma factor [Anaerohalosphaeraceae bacterium]